MSKASIFAHEFKEGVKNSAERCNDGDVLDRKWLKFLMVLYKLQSIFDTVINQELKTFHSSWAHNFRCFREP